MARIDTLVDSNVLIDVWSADPDWSEWSRQAIASARRDGELVINPLIYAELAMPFDSPEQAHQAVSTHLFRRDALPYEAAFLAGRAFLAYRRAGGNRRSPLPDFYIGAHAKVRGYRLLTRDAGRYRTYFPEVSLITPASSFS